jgi:dipeptidyl aminopeptidase/acylaminoacyl peptidase
VDARTAAPHGTWPSPLAAADLARSPAAYDGLAVDGDAVWWLLEDPADEGRVAVWAAATSPDEAAPSRDGARRVSREGFSARTQLHEYGGGALAVGHGIVLACSWDDQRVHRLDPGTGASTPVTPAPQTPRGIRWAGMQVLPGGRGFLAIRETVGPDRPHPRVDVHGRDESVTELVAVSLADASTTVLVSGPDFVGGPWPDPSGRRVAWLQWDHPDMPWDAAELWVADLVGAEGLVTGVADPVRVAGGRDAGSAVCDAAWDRDALLFCDDPTGWWAVHRWDGERVERLHDDELDAGLPRWVNGVSRLAVVGGAPHVVAGDGVLLRVGDGPVDAAPLRSISRLAAAGEQLVAIGGGPATPTGVWRIDPATGEVARLSPAVDDPAAAVGAEPREITFPTPDGARAHALHYPPTSRTAVGPAGELPPLVVLSHGGPTAAARRTVNPTAQYWASRGYAVVDVDYRGSTGYGRAYRDALRGMWGVLDVADCVAAAQHLVAEGLADGDRLVIEGGSAGGYTTLLALCTTDVFAAGGSLFGVADLRALARDTHKLESRYLESLLGARYPGPPEEEQVYVDRSPLTHVDRLRTPMVVLQGDEDRVVPPSQAEAIVAALRERGIPHAYLLFQGEQHGFRKAANIARSVEAREAFYARVLGFEPATPLDLPEYVPGAPRPQDS